MYRKRRVPTGNIPVGGEVKFIHRSVQVIVTVYWLLNMLRLEKINAKRVCCL